MSPVKGVNSDAAPGSASGPLTPLRLVGDYEVIRPIGRGGIAIVYLARQASLDRRVALKELSSFQLGSDGMAERFLRESRIASSLNHPSVVTVFEYFEHDDVPYISMEYMQRGSLRPYVGCLSLAQFVGVMEGVLAGLAHAETFGIVHRDLKPENLLVTDEGRVKITDFGIAKATQTARAGGFLTTTGTTVGTPAYMAPEQAMAQRVGTWTDLYSVGVMAWEHMVGRGPFHDAEAPMIVVLSHINEPIPPAIAVNPETDPDISDWIDRLLAKKPEERTRSPIAAWDELEEIAIRRLGAKWRNDARLPTATQILATSKPLTPVPFNSQKEATVDPPADTPPQGPKYETFNKPASDPAKADPVPPDPVASEPPPEAILPETVEQQTLPPTRAPTVAPAPSPPSTKTDSTGAESPERPRRRLRTVLRLSAVAAAAATLAFVVSTITQAGTVPAARAERLSSGPLAISLPPDWQRSPMRSLPGIALQNEIAARPRASLDDLLVVGTTRTSDPTLLPGALLAELPRTPSGEVAPLHGLHFYRYPNLTPRGSGLLETAYALPTSTGTVIALCISDQRSTQFAASCEHVLSALGLTSGSALALGPSHTYGVALDLAINKLNLSTHAAQAKLANARSAGAQAAAAQQLATVYGHAAASLPKADPSLVAAPAEKSLSAALAAVETGYAQLAHAAAAGQARAYDAARASIGDAQTMLQHSLAELARFGYRPRAVSHRPGLAQ